MDKIIFAISLLACVLLFAGCNGLDTSWHLHQGKIHDSDDAKEQIMPGQDSWRFVRFATPGEELPGGLVATGYDVLWEWRMELTNISKQSWQIKTKYFLVTADKLRIASSDYPADKDAWDVLQPGQKKTFTGRGFVDKKYISRITRGRGLIGKQPTKKIETGPGKETGK